MLIHYSQAYAAPTKVNSGGAFVQFGAGDDKDDGAKGGANDAESSGSGLKINLDVMTNITDKIVENQKEAKEEGLKTPEERIAKIVKKAAEKKKEAESKKLKEKGQTDDDFKGRKKDHENKEIPDKIVNHYPGDQQGKTADQAPKDGKAKKKDKPKKEEPAEYNAPDEVAFAN